MSAGWLVALVAVVVLLLVTLAAQPGGDPPRGQDRCATSTSSYCDSKP
jgi:hypothetical protein